MVTFANGKTFGTLRIFGEKRVYQGMERNLLAISIPATDISLEEAKALWKNAEATAEITVAANEQTKVLLNYSLPVELVTETLNVSDDERVEVLTIRIAQKSALELAQERQAVDIAACEAAIIDIGELLGGE